MHAHRLVLRPQTAFGSPLTGDMLFGQFCWGVRWAFGEARLDELLDAYCEGRPFAVFSDAFPHGFTPLPTVPSFLRTDSNDSDRKNWKSRRWVPVEHMGKSVDAWWDNAVDDEQAYPQTSVAMTGKSAKPRFVMQPHNSINRLTGTTGTEAFAPYTQQQLWYHPDTCLDIYLLLDEDRLGMADFLKVFSGIGKDGYGRDASIGLGKFEMEISEVQPLSIGARAQSFMTLASCAPQGLGYDSANSYYQIKTHFGRHGDLAALSDPFKRPVLMARTGAVFSLPDEQETLFLGQGIPNTSRAHANAVHQGYAPVVPISGLRRIA